MATTTIDTTRATGAPNRPARDPISERIRDAFVYVTEGAKVADALEAVRRSRMPAGQAACVFVIDGHGRYKGYARLSALLRADEESTITALVEGADLAVPHDTEQEAAARRLQLRDVPLLPVVNAKSEMIGILTFDDAMDILEQETTDDIMYKAGVGDVFNTVDHVRSERLTQGPIWYTVRVRILFLMVTLAGGLIVGGLIDQFEDVLGAVIALAIFIPLVMDMGGNVGTQSSTIFARGFALGHVTMQDFWRKSFFREAAVGLVMAVGIALVAGTVAYFWQGLPNDIPQLGIVVGVALFTSVFTAACLGFLMPYVMVRMGIDHAPGADPFITTIKDFTGLLVYFLMASWLIGIDLDSDDTAMMHDAPAVIVAHLNDVAD
ncbi:magnesium transporter [Roseinatronobacter sp. S2]|uniref:magnesium transporter n=1 Tax=Roseinatronobacter sp. S2 TaxID=3035471 RepID=UPI00240FA0E8|nr:magnesium transporter [Roseinatronobacter sp. S2]WFE75212.1 magnesium transporter [Roseinatronobacter sp. S2]